MNVLEKFTPMMLATMEIESKLPSMAEYIQGLLAQPQPDMAVHVSMRRTLVNELDSKKYPETAGRWPMVRKAFREQMKVRKAGGMSGLGEEMSAAGGVASAVGAVGGMLTGAIMLKYQMDQMRKLERKQEAKERAAEEAAVKTAAAEKTRSLLMAKLTARTGSMTTIGQADAAAQQIAGANTVRAVGTMARQEVANQQRLDNQLKSQDTMRTAAMVGVPVAGAVMFMR